MFDVSCMLVIAAAINLHGLMLFNVYSQVGLAWLYMLVNMSCCNLCAMHVCSPGQVRYDGYPARPVCRDFGCINIACN